MSKKNDYAFLGIESLLTLRQRILDQIYHLDNHSIMSESDKQTIHAFYISELKKINVYIDNYQTKLDF